MSVQFQDGKVFCSRCRGYFKLLRVMEAAKLAHVDRRTVYRYIEEGSVMVFRMAGKTYRICSGCLLKEDVPN